MYKQFKKALKQKKRNCTDKLRAFGKMSVSDSDKESISSRSNKEGEV